MDPNALKRQGDYLFKKKSSIDTLWQEIADHFYPERAHFRISRDPGDEFASHLMSGYPIMARRDLGNAFASMLRRDKWFHIRADRSEAEDAEAKRWLEWATDVQRRAMYDVKTKFIRATKEGDQDFAAFGQCVISVEVYSGAAHPHLLYRCWHLKDVAWCENAVGEIDTVHRKWKPTARDLAGLFKGRLHPKVLEMLAKGQDYNEVQCRHVVYPRDETSWVSVYLDVENDHPMEEKVLKHFPYVIPRWQTVSESQYSYSPAVVAALPDARLLQAMTLTLLEAGELSVRPPMLAVQEAIRSDVNLMAGGITWTDAQYDERLGEVLRPLTQSSAGFPAAFRMEEGIRAAIADSFFLNKLNLPITGEMTAYEVSQRVQEFIRNALPLFEPMEHEYNGALCNATFELLMQNGAFGNDMPESLMGADVEFRFASPLQDAVDREHADQFTRMIQMMVEAAEVDRTLIQVPNMHVAFRDAISGLGAPEKWLKTEAEAEAAVAEEQENQAMDLALEQAGQVAQMAGR